MKYCVKCGQQLSDDARFCDKCGYAFENVNAEPEDIDRALMLEEKECLDKFYRFFKYERLAWKIEGIVFTVISCLFFGLALICLLIAIDDIAALAGVFACSMYGLMFLPIAIIGLKMVGKAEYYMNVIYKDARPVVIRCNSIGMLVFSYFFNTIAMAFIIVNFVFNKTNKQILARVIQRQQSINQ